MNLSLSDAFARFGAKPSNRLRGLSAMAADGALVLNYEDRLSRLRPAVATRSFSVGTSRWRLRAPCRSGWSYPRARSAAARAATCAPT